MFAFTPGRRLCPAVLLALDLLLGSCGRPARTLTAGPPPVLLVAPPTLSVVMTRADGSGIIPDQHLVAAEQAQVYEGLHIWLIRNARPVQLHMLPAEAKGPVAGEAIKALAAQQQAQTVLLTHVYHHRDYLPVPVVMQAPTVVTQTTGAGNVTTIPTPTPEGRAYKEEVSVYFTLYQADGTILWKHSRRITPEGHGMTAGRATDWIMTDALSTMPLPGK